jgi:hypothetical protein
MGRTRKLQDGRTECNITFILMQAFWREERFPLIRTHLEWNI